MYFYQNFIQILFKSYPNFVILGHLLLSNTPILLRPVHILLSKRYPDLIHILSLFIFILHSRTLTIIYYADTWKRFAVAANLVESTSI